MVFRFCPQILEDNLLHKPLHQVPVFHYPMTDGPLAAREGNDTSVNHLTVASTTLFTFHNII